MTHWITPTTLPTLTSNALCIWRLYLPDAQQTMPHYLGVLSETEKTACMRFKFADLQRRYAITRFGLRYLLGHYCQKAPLNIIIETGEHGKPYLPNHTLHFNISHSGDYVLYAFSAIPEILLGIDVERIRNRDELAIAKRFFAPAEYATLAALPTTQKAEAFFHVWTQKEAFIKAIGQGLSYALDGFETSVTGAVKLLKITDERYRYFNWYSSELTVATGYKACVTSSKKPVDLYFYTLRGF